MNHFTLESVSVGYEARSILSGVDLSFLAGKLTCILGANGSGKTTLLKTLAGILPRISGDIVLRGRELSAYRPRELAHELAAVLTDRVVLENATAFDVAAMGRSPHTGFFGVLSEEDRAFTGRCLAKCGALTLADKLFQTLSDGEKQKVLIARGLAQSPNVLILDEPTSHLDIRYKLEVLETLRSFCVEEGRTVLCTLHEPDLALKCCDCLALVRGGEIAACGDVQEVVDSGALDVLYGLEPGQLDLWTGSVEFRSPDSRDVFIIGSTQETIPLLRAMQRAGLGVAAGVWHASDAACRVAAAMGMPVCSVPAYTPVTGEDVERALAIACTCKVTVWSGGPVCAINHGNLELLRLIQERGMPCLHAQDLSAAVALERIKELWTSAAQK